MQLDLHKLKIKIKHLALEPAIIRKEEWRLRNSNRTDEAGVLEWHRRWDVRNEARATQLVYALLRGKKYSEVEQPKSRELDWPVYKSMVRMINNYGYYMLKDKTDLWNLPHNYHPKTDNKKTIKCSVTGKYWYGTEREGAIFEFINKWIYADE